MGARGPNLHPCARCGGERESAIWGGMNGRDVPLCRACKARIVHGRPSAPCYRCAGPRPKPYVVYTSSRERARASIPVCEGCLPIVRATIERTLTPCAGCGAARKLPLRAKINGRMAPACVACKLEPLSGAALLIAKARLRDMMTHSGNAAQRERSAAVPSPFQTPRRSIQ